MSEAQTQHWCITHRKHGCLEQFWFLSPITGATKELADEFRRRVFAPLYGGDTGKHTTHVELEVDVVKEHNWDSDDEGEE